MELLDGLVLAATAAGDRAGAAAAAGLAPGLARALAERSAALAEMPRAARHAHVKAIAERLAALAAGAVLPPRARSILAEAGSDPAFARPVGGPAVRRGFRVTPALRTTLLRAASARPIEEHEIELVRSAAWRA